MEEPKSKEREDNKSSNSKIKITGIKFQQNPIYNVNKSENVLLWIDERWCKVELFGKFHLCRLLITEFKIMIIPKISTQMFETFLEDYFVIPLKTIYKFSIINKNSKEDDQYKYFYLEIETQDLRDFKLLFIQNEETENLYEKITKIKSPFYLNREGHLIYAIKYRQLLTGIYGDNKKNNIYLSGYKIYNEKCEYARQGIEYNKFIISTEINKNFTICDSYPETTYLIVNNQKVNIVTYKQAAYYHLKNRYPTLCYYYEKTKGSIWRTSLNKEGKLYQENIYDKLISTLLVEFSGIKQIIDVSENGLSIEYDNNQKIIISFPFPHLDDIEIINDSYIKLRNVLLKNKKSITVTPILDDDFSLLIGTELDNLYSNTNFYTEIEKTGWFKLIYQIITTSISIYKCVIMGMGVIIRCGEGKDVCLVLTSLASLFLDDYYRTLFGFIILIEKEFVSFGHPFKNRFNLNGVGNKNKNLDNISSPVFLLFLDCIHQFVKEFPEIFEFNLNLLNFIGYHLYSGKYGTFLYNSEKERTKDNAYEKTESIWTEVANNRQKYINQEYDSNLNKDFVFRNFPYFKIKLWDEYFLKYYKSSKSFGGIKCNKNKKNEKIEKEKLKLQNEKIKLIIKKLMDAKNKTDNNNDDKENNEENEDNEK